MKSFIYTLLFLLGTGYVAQAQAPEAIKYQAAIRDSDGKRITSSPVGVQIRIIKDSADGSAVYTETFSETTTASGLLNIEIGNGTATEGTFTDIDWGASTYYIELSLDIAGGSSYSLMGTTQLVSVPYALYANKTEGSQVITKSERTALTEVATGTMIYCSDCGASGELQIYNGTGWTNMIGDPIVE